MKCPSAIHRMAVAFFVTTTALVANAADAMGFGEIKIGNSASAVFEACGATGSLTRLNGIDAYLNVKCQGSLAGVYQFYFSQSNGSLVMAKKFVSQGLGEWRPSQVRDFFHQDSTFTAQIERFFDEHDFHYAPSNREIEKFRSGASDNLVFSFASGQVNTIVYRNSDGLIASSVDYRAAPFALSCLDAADCDFSENALPLHKINNGPAQEERASKITDSGENADQIQTFIEIFSENSAWARPSGLREGTRSWNEWDVRRRGIRADIPFSLSSALSLAKSNGFTPDDRDIHSILTLDTSGTEDLIKYIASLHRPDADALGLDPEDQAFRDHYVFGWHCFISGSEDIRQQISRYGLRCLFPMRKPRIGGSSSVDTLISRLLLSAEGLAGVEGNSVVLQIDNFLNAPVEILVGLDPAFPEFTIFADNSFTKFLGPNEAYRNDVIEFDGYVVCFDDERRINDCHVLATRVENLGEYRDGMLPE